MGRYPPQKRVAIILQLFSFYFFGRTFPTSIPAFFNFSDENKKELHSGRGAMLAKTQAAFRLIEMVNGFNANFNINSTP